MDPAERAAAQAPLSVLLALCSAAAVVSPAPPLLSALAGIGSGSAGDSSSSAGAGNSGAAFARAPLSFDDDQWSFTDTSIPTSSRSHSNSESSYSNNSNSSIDSISGSRDGGGGLLPAAQTPVLAALLSRAPALQLLRLASLGLTDAALFPLVATLLPAGLRPPALEPAAAAVATLVRDSGTGGRARWGRALAVLDLSDNPVSDASVSLLLPLLASDRGALGCVVLANTLCSRALRHALNDPTVALPCGDYNQSSSGNGGDNRLFMSGADAETRALGMSLLAPAAAASDTAAASSNATAALVNGNALQQPGTAVTASATASTSARADETERSQYQAHIYRLHEALRDPHGAVAASAHAAMRRYVAAMGRLNVLKQRVDNVHSDSNAKDDADAENATEEETRAELARLSAVVLSKYDALDTAIETSPAIPAYLTSTEDDGLTSEKQQGGLASSSKPYGPIALVSVRPPNPNLQQQQRQQPVSANSAAKANHTANGTSAIAGAGSHGSTVPATSAAGRWNGPIRYVAPPNAATTPALTSSTAAATFSPSSNSSSSSSSGADSSSGASAVGALSASAVRRLAQTANARPMLKLNTNIVNNNNNTNSSYGNTSNMNTVNSTGATAAATAGGPSKIVVSVPSVSASARVTTPAVKSSFEQYLESVKADAARVSEHLAAVINQVTRTDGAAQDQQQPEKDEKHSVANDDTEKSDSAPAVTSVTSAAAATASKRASGGVPAGTVTSAKASADPNNKKTQQQQQQPSAPATARGPASACSSTDLPHSAAASATATTSDAAVAAVAAVALPVTAAQQARIEDKLARSLALLRARITAEKNSGSVNAKTATEGTSTTSANNSTVNKDDDEGRYSKARFGVPESFFPPLPSLLTQQQQHLQSQKAGKSASGGAAVTVNCETAPADVVVAAALHKLRLTLAQLTVQWAEQPSNNSSSASNITGGSSPTETATAAGALSPKTNGAVPQRISVMGNANYNTASATSGSISAPAATSALALAARPTHLQWPALPAAPAPAQRQLRAIESRLARRRAAAAAALASAARGRRYVAGLYEAFFAAHASALLAAGHVGRVVTAVRAAGAVTVGDMAKAKAKVRAKAKADALEAKAKVKAKVRAAKVHQGRARGGASNSNSNSDDDYYAVSGGHSHSGSATGAATGYVSTPDNAPHVEHISTPHSNSNSDNDVAGDGSGSDDDDDEDDDNDDDAVSIATTPVDTADAGDDAAGLSAAAAVSEPVAALHAALAERAPPAPADLVAAFAASLPRAVAAATAGAALPAALDYAWACALSHLTAAAVTRADAEWRAAVTAANAAVTTAVAAAADAGDADAATAAAAAAVAAATTTYDASAPAPAATAVAGADAVSRAMRGAYTADWQGRMRAQAVGKLPALAAAVESDALLRCAASAEQGLKRRVAARRVELLLASAPGEVLTWAARNHHYQQLQMQQLQQRQSLRSGAVSAGSNPSSSSNAGRSSAGSNASASVSAQANIAVGKAEAALLQSSDPQSAAAVRARRTQLRSVSRALATLEHWGVLYAGPGAVPPPALALYSDVAAEARALVIATAAASVAAAANPTLFGSASSSASSSHCEQKEQKEQSDCSTGKVGIPVGVPPLGPELGRIAFYLANNNINTANVSDVKSVLNNTMKLLASNAANANNNNSTGANANANASVNSKAVARLSYYPDAAAHTLLPSLLALLSPAALATAAATNAAATSSASASASNSASDSAAATNSAASARTEGCALDWVAARALAEVGASAGASLEWAYATNPVCFAEIARALHFTQHAADENAAVQSSVLRTATAIATDGDTVAGATASASARGVSPLDVVTLEANANIIAADLSANMSPLVKYGALPLASNSTSANGSTVNPVMSVNTSDKVIVPSLWPVFFPRGLTASGVTCGFTTAPDGFASAPGGLTSSGYNPRAHSQHLSLMRSAEGCGWLSLFAPGSAHAHAAGAVGAAVAGLGLPAAAVAAVARALALAQLSRRALVLTVLLQQVHALVAREIAYFANQSQAATSGDDVYDETDDLISGCGVVVGNGVWAYRLSSPLNKNSNTSTAGATPFFTDSAASVAAATATNVSVSESVLMIPLAQLWTGVQTTTTALSAITSNLTKNTNNNAVANNTTSTTTTTNLVSATNGLVYSASCGNVKSHSNSATSASPSASLALLQPPSAAALSATSALMAPLLCALGLPPSAVSSSASASTSVAAVTTTAAAAAAAARGAPLCTAAAASADVFCGFGRVQGWETAAEAAADPAAGSEADAEGNWGAAALVLTEGEKREAGAAPVCVAKGFTFGALLTNKSHSNVNSDHAPGTASGSVESNAAALGLLYDESVANSNVFVSGAHAVDRARTSKLRGDGASGSAAMPVAAELAVLRGLPEPELALASELLYSESSEPAFTVTLNNSTDSSASFSTAKTPLNAINSNGRDAVSDISAPPLWLLLRARRMHTALAAVYTAVLTHLRSLPAEAFETTATASTSVPASSISAGAGARGGSAWFAAQRELLSAGLARRVAAAAARKMLRVAVLLRQRAVIRARVRAVLRQYNAVATDVKPFYSSLYEGGNDSSAPNTNTRNSAAHSKAASHAATNVHASRSESRCNSDVNYSAHDMLGYTIATTPNTGVPRLDSLLMPHNRPLTSRAFPQPDPASLPTVAAATPVPAPAWSAAALAAARLNFEVAFDHVAAVPQLAAALPYHAGAVIRTGATAQTSALFAPSVFRYNPRAALYCKQPVVSQARSLLSTSGPTSASGSSGSAPATTSSSVTASASASAAQSLQPPVRRLQSRQNSNTSTTHQVTASPSPPPARILLQQQQQQQQQQIQPHQFHQS